MFIYFNTFSFRDLFRFVRLSVLFFISVLRIKKNVSRVHLCVMLLLYFTFYVKIFKITHLIRIELHTTGNASSSISPVTHIEVVIGKIETKQKIFFVRLLQMAKCNLSLVNYWTWYKSVRSFFCDFKPLILYWHYIASISLKLIVRIALLIRIVAHKSHCFQIFLEIGQNETKRK